MKIWIVWCDYFEDHSIEGIFSSREKAATKMMEMRNKNLDYHFFSIEVFEVQ